MPFTFGIYQVSDADALAAALAFDQACLANYDFSGRSVPDAVDVADVGRLIGSQMVGFTMEVGASLIRHGAAAPWADVPIDARLEDADPIGHLYAASCNLWDYFDSLSGVGDAIATKLLGLKRSALFPVVDYRVSRAYASVAARFHVRRPTLAAIRHDVVLASEQQALGTLRSALRSTSEFKAQRLAQLPGIRLRDIVLWQRWQGFGPPPTPAQAPVPW